MAIAHLPTISEQDLLLQEAWKLEEEKIHFELKFVESELQTLRAEHEKIDHSKRWLFRAKEDLKMKILNI